MTQPLVIFDLDGTLLDTASDLIGAVNRVMAEEGLPPIDPVTYRATVGKGGRAMVSAALGAAGVEAEVRLLDRLTERFIDQYIRHVAEHTRPFPGAMDALDRLTAADVRLAVCTNKREVLAIELFEKLEILERFVVICGGDTFPVRKPDPQHILGTIEAAGGDPATTIMVGDSAADIDAARAAGVKVVAVTFGYTDIHVSELGADVVIDHFDDLLPALAALSPALADKLDAKA
ncbi:HAD-IA family hydrolase [Methylobrevis pamukkalensis]|uniref:Phosphoglycolate phosphatase n=1 Tax=Methylobrevis pamukkalensis TaxID=1439726 RepID=A0A1E3H2M8_9HYPH|nr:HAD-IA family hydrolase [Methylobrevis pamukkalensis]ODN70579.1 Phosphoglycolate phosphatase [Methylobrevis pamukkalensis]